MRFERPEVDLGVFDRPLDLIEPLYGLPKEVKFCRTCVISNQKPTSAVEYKHTSASKKETVDFDSEGICSACRVSERKRSVDWSVRRKELSDLCDRFRKNDGSFDCLVPGSGGKDSFFTAHVLKHEFGMHPLTITWAPHLYTDWGWANMQSWVHAGFDNLLYTPNGRVHRLLTRLAVENLFHPFQPFFYGQKSLAPKYAAKLNIPLIFYGENEAEYGNRAASFSSSRQDTKYFALPRKDELFIGGVSARELLEDFGLSDNDLDPYMPADPDQIADFGIGVYYLSYFLKWHPQACYYYACQHSDFQPCPERNPGTFSKYASLDDKIDDLNFYTTFVKFGIGRATYDASQEVRSGDITRDEAVALVRRYDGEFPERFMPELLEYLSLPPRIWGAVSGLFAQPVMDRQYFDQLCDKFRSPHLWHRQDGKWALRYRIGDSSEGESRPALTWQVEHDAKWTTS